MQHLPIRMSSGSPRTACSKIIHRHTYITILFLWANIIPALFTTIPHHRPSPSNSVRHHTTFDGLKKVVIAINNPYFGISGARAIDGLPGGVQ